MSQDIIFLTNGQANGLLVSNYDSNSLISPSTVVRMDNNVAFSLQPVLPAPTGSEAIYQPDYLSSDVLSLAVGNYDQPATAGTFTLGVSPTTIFNTLSGTPTNIQTAAAHHLATGNQVFISEVNHVPNGYYTVTVTGSTAFTIPITTASDGGTGQLWLVNGTSGSNLTNQPFNQSAANLQTVLNAALSQLSLPQCTVQLLSTGNYRVVATTNQAIASGIFELDPSDLDPLCTWSAMEESLGSNTGPYIVLLAMRQAPVIYANPTTPLPATGVSVETIQQGAVLSTVAISSNSVASATVVTTDSNHGLVTNQQVFISNSNSTPPINGLYPATVLSPTTFSIAVTVTVAGTAGSVQTVPQDQIQQIQFTQPNTYSGSFAIALTAQNPAPQTISGNTAANPTVVATTSPHGLAAGQQAFITGSNSTPSINGLQPVTVTGSTTFTVPVNVSNAGTAGQVAGIVTQTCGVAYPTMSNQQIGQLLANHPYVSYSAGASTGNNIIPTQIGEAYQVEFTGTLGNNPVPQISASNINLVGPEGFSGLLDANTVELYEYSLSQSNNFSLPISIIRTRTSGELRTIWYGSLSIQKDNLNLSSAVNVSLPSCVIISPTGALINPTAANFFNINLTTWMNGLPTTLQPPGNWYNNGGIPTLAE